MIFQIIFQLSLRLRHVKKVNHETMHNLFINIIKTLDNPNTAYIELELK